MCATLFTVRLYYLCGFMLTLLLGSHKLTLVAAFTALASASSLCCLYARDVDTHDDVTVGLSYSRNAEYMYMHAHFVLFHHIIGFLSKLCNDSALTCSFPGGNISWFHA